MHLFLTSTAEGIDCRFCAETTKTIAQKATVKASGSTLFRLRDIIAQRYIFFASLPRLSGTPSKGRGIGGNRYCSQFSYAIANHGTNYCLLPVAFCLLPKKYYLRGLKKPTVR
jgi:hypothetical protein